MSSSRGPPFLFSETATNRAYDSCDSTDEGQCDDGSRVRRGRGRGDLRARDLRRVGGFFQQADSFWEFILAFFQGIFWPAFMVYEVFKALAT